MARSLWNGVIAFGLVRVPVKLYSANESKAIRFRERHSSDGAAIEHRRVCVKEDKEVPYSDIVKGYEVAPGSYVVLSKEEVAAADGPAAHVIEIEHFVGLAEIDPIYYERCFYLGPGKLGAEPYRLLHTALERSGRAGIGRFVFHNRSHLATIRPLEDLIALHTMRFADELVGGGELQRPRSARAPTKQEVQIAQTLVGQMTDIFKPDAYEDTYRQAVLDMIARKAHGETIEAPQVQPARTDDLLGALRASIEDHGRRRTSRRHAATPRRRTRTPAGGH